jgi:hypothetical protein|tara:strand:- start:161 stop:385 length:225 start_codon:yes stop_codon:yes gene_type:complete
MTNPTIKIHERIMQTVVELTEEEHDPFAVAGCLLAIAIFVYRSEKMEWNTISNLLSECVKQSVISEGIVKETLH